jgi:hypothetical protein
MVAILVHFKLKWPRQNFGALGWDYLLFMQLWETHKYSKVGIAFSRGYGK